MVAKKNNEMDFIMNILMCLEGIDSGKLSS